MTAFMAMLVDAYRELNHKKLFWVTLVNGEKLADRGLLTPWVGMWAANVVGGVAGLWMTVRIALDRRATPTRWSRFVRRLFPLPEDGEPQE